jgi:DNA polymerase-3 subunit beta
MKAKAKSEQESILKFTVQRSALLAELTQLSNVAEKKASIPILSAIKLVASETGLSLTATDLDLSLLSTIEAEIANPGTVIVSARNLVAIIKSLPDQEIDFEIPAKADTQMLVIHCGGSQFKLSVFDVEHFPAINEVKNKAASLPAQKFLTAIDRTVFAITQEKSRYALNGALLLIEGGTLRLVATDGHRLALSTFDGMDSVRVKDIIPKKTLSVLHGLIADHIKQTKKEDKESEATIQFSQDENHLCFEMGNRRLVSRMLAGQFPNYDLVIPKNNDRIVVLSVERFTAAVRRTRLMADERSHGIKLSLSKNLLTFSAQSPDVGEMKETMPVEYTGEEMEIGFNADYIQDVLAVVETEQIVLALKDDMSPAMLTPNGDENYKHILMPVRLI